MAVNDGSGNVSTLRVGPNGVVTNAPIASDSGTLTFTEPDGTPLITVTAAETTFASPVVTFGAESEWVRAVVWDVKTIGQPSASEFVSFAGYDRVRVVGHEKLAVPDGPVLGDTTTVRQGTTTFQVTSVGPSSDVVTTHGSTASALPFLVRWPDGRLEIRADQSLDVVCDGTNVATFTNQAFRAHVPVTCRGADRGTAAAERIHDRAGGRVRGGGGGASVRRCDHAVHPTVVLLDGRRGHAAQLHDGVRQPRPVQGTGHPGRRSEQRQLRGLRQQRRRHRAGALFDTATTTSVPLQCTRLIAATLDCPDIGPGKLLVGPNRVDVTVPLHLTGRSQDVTVRDAVAGVQVGDAVGTGTVTAVLGTHEVRVGSADELKSGQYVQIGASLHTVVLRAVWSEAGLVTDAVRAAGADLKLGTAGADCLTVTANSVTSHVPLHAGTLTTDSVVSTANTLTLGTAARQDVCRLVGGDRIESSTARLVATEVETQVVGNPSSWPPRTARKS